jgi:hypothetical protein
MKKQNSERAELLVALTVIYARFSIATTCSSVASNLLPANVMTKGKTKFDRGFLG